MALIRLNILSETINTKNTEANLGGSNEFAYPEIHKPLRKTSVAQMNLLILKFLSH